MNIHLVVKPPHLRKKRVQDLIARFSQKHSLRIVSHQTIDETQNDIRAHYQPNDVLVIAGGDGTVHHAIQALAPFFKDEQKRPTIAVFPFGSGNDFARAFAIPKKIKPWFSMFERAKSTTIDLGFIEPPHNRYYLCCASFGVSADASQLAQRTSLITPRIRYLLATILALMRIKKFHLSIRTDHGLQSRYMNTLHAVVANTKFFGSGIVAAKYADPSDGVQNFIGLTHSLAYALAHIVSVLRGNVLHLKHTRATNVQAISIATDEPVPIQADGEFIGHTPARLQTIPRALRVVVT